MNGSDSSFVNSVPLASELMLLINRYSSTFSVAFWIDISSIGPERHAIRDTP